MEHVSCLAMCMCGALRRSMAMEQVCKVRANRLVAVKNKCGGLEGPRHEGLTMGGWFLLEKY